MNSTNLIKTVFVVFAFILFGCNHSPTNTMKMDDETDHLIPISQQQFVSNKMKIGEITTRIFEDKIRCNGYIMAPAKGMATVSSQLAGIVESINYCPGEYVKKGTILFTLSSPSLIILQQDYAESSAKLNRLKSDYERSKTLFAEKIGAEKDLIGKESEYKAMAAMHYSLKLQLELLGLNIQKIEAGNLYSKLPIKAPISGYITQQEIVLGQFIEQQKQLIEIVDINQLQLELSIFENNVSALKTGQNIRFNLLGEKPASHQAKLISIGRSIDSESKTIQCIAQIKSEENTNFINRSFVEADIIVKSREAKALPNEAILKLENQYYVFVLEKKAEQTFYLRKVKIMVGNISNDYSEIIEAGNLKNIITEGVYNLRAD